MVDNLSKPVHALPVHMLTSLSVDEILIFRVVQLLPSASFQLIIRIVRPFSLLIGLASLLNSISIFVGYLMLKLFW